VVGARPRLWLPLSVPRWLGSSPFSGAAALWPGWSRNLNPDTSREGSGCKLCPRDRLLHGDKCYWLSKERKDWTGSRDDCSGKSSRMLVTQNREEMDFIQDVVQDANHIWIGLKVTPPGGKWTWVDGSPLDPVRFSGSADGNSCGWIKGSQVLSETCAAELKWICQKEAAVI
ncbi:unnamed protein product, partial [Natator depressus]